MPPASGRQDQASRLLRFTRSTGGNVAAVEFMNEPDLAAIGGAPPGYDAHAYAKDFRIFLSFMKQAAPETMILGPGTVSEDAVASDLLAASASGLDAVSYHFYGTVSQRCRGKATPDGALSEDWLSRTDRTLAFYQALRDRLAPRQADLAHRNRRGRVRRQPLGRELPGYVPLSRSTRPAREIRRRGRHAQHARRQRLRPARREDA